LLLALAVACSDDDSDAEDVSTATGGASEASGELCDKLDDLDSAVSEARNLDQSSSVDDAQEARSDIEDAIDEVRDAASGVAVAALSALQTAMEALGDTIDSLSGDQSVGTAVNEITGQADAIEDALSGLRGQSGCS
jgi:hypothetical protein